MRSHLVPTDTIRSIRLSGDRSLTVVSWALWFMSLCFAPMYDTWIVWFLCATFLAGTVSTLTFVIPGTRGSRIGIGQCLVGFAALMVHQSHGVIETHFAYFILLPLLLYYRDWRPIVFAAVTICVQHFLFCWMQMNDYPVYIFSSGHRMSLVIVHGAYVAAETLMLVYVTQTIRREALESSAIAAFGERINRSGKLDLSFDSSRHRGAAARGLTSLLNALDGVTRHSEALATRITRVSEEIAASSSSMLHLSESQSRTAVTVFHSVESMSDASSRIKEDCSAVALVANQSAAIVTDGCATIQQTADLMLTVAESSASTVAEIKHLQTESARIETIVHIMNDLSGQSGLLALNASIEAARAGEKGKGFQVVAQEIRNLSERSYQSLVEVQSIVDTIGVRVTQLQLQADRCQSAATLGGSQVRAAHTALTEVAQHLPNVAERVGQALRTAGHNALTSAEVLSGMTGIEEAIHENADEMKSLAALSKSLEQMAEELSANVSQFQHGSAPRQPAAA